MMQRLTRTQLYWMKSALQNEIERHAKAAADEDNSDTARAVARLQSGNLSRICDTLQVVLADPKALRIAID